MNDALLFVSPFRVLELWNSDIADHLGTGTQISEPRGRVIAGSNVPAKTSR